MEYSHTEDSKSWQPVYLERSLSEKILGMDNIASSLVEDTSRNPLNDDENASDTTPESPRATSFPAMTMELMEECLMEPLVHINDNYIPESMRHNFIPTLHAITNGDESIVLVSASSYGLKHLMFTITGCVLCASDDGTPFSVYVPSTLLRKTRDDLTQQSFQCKIASFDEHAVFHRVVLPPRLVPKCFDVYGGSVKKTTTRSHTPLLRDGFNRYCNANLMVSIALTPSRTTEPSSFDGSIIVQHGRRIISIIVLDITGM